VTAAQGTPLIGSSLLPGDTPPTFEGRAMASALRLTPGGATAADVRLAARAWEAVVDVFAAAEAAMSRFRDTSELTGLNRIAGSGTIAPVSSMLRQALVAADRAHRITSGRFDPRVLSDLDRLGYAGAALGRRPGHRSAAERRGRDARIVRLAGRHDATLDEPVDLGGIGKGLALRWATTAVERGGVADFLLEAGGDLVARGMDPDGAGWPLGIEDPRGRVEHLAVIDVTDCAVATSSIGVHRWTVGGRTVHHLIDPRTGEPAASGLAAVTVAAHDPAWAEVWSKVLFVGGRSRIADEVRARGLAAWWVTDDGDLEMTPAARGMTLWVEGEGSQNID
jgi:thiamine biosynthesis lipoprotein